ncbi:uncharacterized protein LOC120822370 isoform X4 [Gasterosteus aculeatus]
MVTLLSVLRVKMPSPQPPHRLPSIFRKPDMEAAPAPRARVTIGPATGGTNAAGDHRRRTAPDALAGLWSRSRSPWSDHPACSRHRSPSRSPERRTSPRRREDRWSSPRRSRERRSSPRWSDGRQSPSRRRSERESPSRRRSERESPSRRRSERESPSRRRSERESPSRRRSERLSPERKTSRTDHLVKKLLETSAVQSLSKQSDLETVVKTLAPALLAELAKMKSTSSSSVGEKPSSSSASKQSAKKASTTNETSEVKLEGVHNVFHSEVVAAVQKFGKIKSVVLHRATEEAIVTFDKVEDARKLRSLKSVDVKGHRITVAGRKETVAKKLKPSQKKPATAVASTPQTTRKAHDPEPSISTLKCPAKPPSSPSGAKTATTSRLQKSGVKGSVKGRGTVTQTKTKNISAKPINKGKLPLKRAVRKTSPGTKSTSPKSTPEEPETKVQGATVVKKDLGEANVPKEAEPRTIEGTGAEVEEPMEVASSAEKEEETTTTEAAAESSADEPAGSRPASSEADTGPTETSGPDSAAQGPENRAEPSGITQEAAGISTEAAEEAELPAGRVETETAGKEFDLEDKTPEAESSAGQSGEREPSSVEASPPTQQSTCPEPQSAAPGPQQEAGTSTEASTEAKPPDPEQAVDTQGEAESSARASRSNAPLATAIGTDAVFFGETLGCQMYPSKIPSVPDTTLSSEEIIAKGYRQLVVGHLPDYDSCCYTEEDLANVLIPFGFQYAEDRIYVLPQSRMAVIVMPTAEDVHKMITGPVREGIFFKGRKLSFRVATDNPMLTPFEFYESLTNQFRYFKCSKSRTKPLRYTVDGKGTQTIFITNISWSEALKLRESLKTIQHVKNFFPLLNKVFVDFESSWHADRLGVWYSLLKRAPNHKVTRLTAPGVHSYTKKPPKHPECALPPSEDAVTGATVPPMEFGIPQGNVEPFWVTLRSDPFLFLTRSPWFIIPKFQTVRTLNDIAKAVRGPKIPTVMLTGLPEGNYRHDDVVKLVRRFFPRWSLSSAFYDVVVLPLQRRAFVFFADWTSCCSFVRDRLRKQVSVLDCPLTAHFVLEDMNPFSTEETMYATLMKWSNAGVPEPEGLEERLLCVETSETSPHITRAVMGAVASVASFAGFLPLANRICIEMTDSGAVAQVVKELNNVLKGSTDKPEAWSEVQHVETVKSLKRRLQYSSENQNLQDGSVKVQTEPLAAKRPTPPSLPGLPDIGSQPAERTGGSGGSTVAQPVPAGPGAGAVSDASLEEDEEKVATESTFGPGDVEKAAEREDEEPLATSAFTADVTSDLGPSPSATALAPQESFAALPQINADVFQAIAAAVRNHRLTRESRSRSEEKERTSRSSRSARDAAAEDAPQTEAQDDATCHMASPDAARFDELNFNMDDFVTVDEVGDDVGDRSPEPHGSSSSRQSSGPGREGQSLQVSAGKQTSTGSWKDSKSTASASPSSSKSTEDLSSLVCGSPTRSSIKPSARARKAVPSSPLSTETPSAHSAAKASTAASSGLRSRSSSARETKRIASAATSSAAASSAATSSAATSSAATSSAATSSAATSSAATSSAATSSAAASSAAASSAATSSAAASSAATSSAATSSAGSLSEQLLEGQDAERTVDESDQKMSETLIETSSETLTETSSETLTETSSETHPPHGERGLQSLEIDINVNTQQQKQSAEEKEEDDVDKRTKAEEDQSHRAVGPLGDRTDDPMDDGERTRSSEAQTSGPNAGQTLRDESLQVADGVGDEVLTGPPRCEEMEVDASLQVLDSVTEGEAATGQEDSSTGTSWDHLQLLDAGSEDTPRDMGDEKRTAEDEVKAMDNGDRLVPNEDSSLPDAGNKENSKDPERDVTGQEAFEILDPIDDLTSAEDHGQNHEMNSGQISQEDILATEDEEDAYRVIDSVEDQPMTTDSETGHQGRRNSRGTATARKDNKPSKRSEPTTTASTRDEKEPSPKKPDRAGQRHETRSKPDLIAKVSEKDKEVPEDVEFKIVDSVEEEPVRLAATPEMSVRRRSARGKKEDKTTVDLTDASNKAQEATYKILDSVDDEEPTARATRGRRGRTTKKEASNEKTEDTPTGRKQTPARESQEPNGGEKGAWRASTPSRRSGSVVSEFSQEERPATRSKGTRGRPKKGAKTTKTSASKDAPGEEEATYRVLDSVEGEAESALMDVDQQGLRSEPLTGSPKDGEEDEPMYRIIDSLDDDQLLTGGDETREGASAEEEDASPRAGEDDGAVEEEPLYRIVDDVDESSPAGPQRDPAGPGMDGEKDDTARSLVNLDEVSEEEEEYPDDTAEEEELRRRQAAAKEKQIAEERAARRTRESEERRTRDAERRSRSGSSSRGGGAGRRREEEETGAVDPQELVTLDEVGADDGGEERAASGTEWDGEITGAELQTLVTLDEFIEGEEEDGKVEQSPRKPRPPSQEEESVDLLDPEALVTLDEAGDDEEEQPDEEPAESRSAKRKSNDDSGLCRSVTT